MPFIPVPNVAHCKIEGVVDSQMTLNNLYFEISGGGINLTNLAALALAVDQWASLTLAPLLSDDWAYVRTTAIDLTNQNGFVWESATPATGGVSGEANPNNVAACVSLRSGVAGRSFRGRNFVPGIPGSVVTLNTLDNLFIADLLANYNQLVGAGTFTAGWQLVVVSRFTAGAPRVTGVASPVTSIIMVGNKVRSMRSREVGHGK